eukprot:CAMPEP_0171491376 /NCGR_PEP_ID=MMETSP0958-20121227/3826_1 /TAXON_ID=87120 /ORGANISM="Aurantiochytrium limacinum, Strain ATCCMYA-1381" /LENGTH=68 /DNA_ID=CAMNT_0012024789 /DNA_START=972 /DNA_END=1174 /DNA_ORIENTATION=+
MVVHGLEVLQLSTFDKYLHLALAQLFKFWICGTLHCVILQVNISLIILLLLLALNLSRVTPSDFVRVS